MKGANAITAFVLAACLAACAGGAPQAPPERAPGGPSPPREVRSGAADMAIQNVEAGVSEAEVAAAVAAMVAEAPVCLLWPALWLEARERNTLFIARFDLMARDWGLPVAAEGEQRMDEFADAGFLTRRQQANGVVHYILTDSGREALRGAPGGASRPSFCAPAGRRLVAITAMEHGRFPCGSLRVRFSHVADAWPPWAATEAMRARLPVPPPNAPGEGSVTLARQWYHWTALPRGVENGALRSMCLSDGRIIGDDLRIAAGAIDAPENQ